MHFFVYKAEKKQQFEFEPVPSAAPPAVADITSATFCSRSDKPAADRGK